MYRARCAGVMALAILQMVWTSIVSALWTPRVPSDFCTMPSQIPTKVLRMLCLVLTVGSKLVLAVFQLLGVTTLMWK